MRLIRRQNVPVDVIFCWYEELGLYRQIDVKLSLLLSMRLKYAALRAAQPRFQAYPQATDKSFFVLKRSTLLTLSIAVSLGCCMGVFSDICDFNLLEVLSFRNQSLLPQRNRNSLFIASCVSIYPSGPLVF